MARKPANPWKQFGPEAVIAPSLLACDFMHVGEQVDAVISAGAEVLHIDIMDGHFVPNLSMGPGFVKCLRPFTDHPLDVHLMVTDPQYFAEKFAEAGADSITFHIEATRDGAAIVKYLHDRGLGAGVSLKPGTPAEALAPVITDVDMVLVMTVEPGYGGQPFMQDMLPKIRRIRSQLGAAQRLEVDGGINPVTAGLCGSAGADTYVAGVDIFRSGDIPKAVADLRRGAAGEK